MVLNVDICRIIFKFWYWCLCFMIGRMFFLLIWGILCLDIFYSNWGCFEIEYVGEGGMK